MKHIASLICLLLISIATPVLALQGSDCSAKSAKLKPTERESFMKSCLAQAEAPANVQEEERKHKSVQCEQNAKNKKLQGNDKTKYHESCMNKNEAAAVASAQPKSSITPKHKSTSGNSPKNAPHKAGKKPKEHSKSAKKSVKQPTNPSGENGGL